jgi:hypothetical protein
MKIIFRSIGVTAIVLFITIYFFDSLFSNFSIVPANTSIEARIELLIEDGAAECEGDFSLTSKAVRVIELGETGGSLTVLDEAEFKCSSSASMYCGSGGCSVHFLLEKESMSPQVQGWEHKDGQLLLGQHGSVCGQVGTKVCYTTVTIKNGRFKFDAW